MIPLKTKFKSLFSPISRSFTVYTNQLFSPSEKIGDETIYYDHNIDDYEPIIQAYLKKRRISKPEIAPKIYAIKPLNSLKKILESQKMMSVKKISWNSADVKEKFKTPDNINSEYIINMTCEESFKEMIDEYLLKIVANGAMPNLAEYKTYEKIKEKAIGFYRSFFYGDPVTSLENEIESAYLEEKLKKWTKYQGNSRPKYKCLWTMANQRSLDNHRNKIAKDLNNFDDFRTFYKRINFEEIHKNVNVLMFLNQNSWLKRFLMNLYSSFVLKRSKSRSAKVASMMLLRTVNYTECIEFTQWINIPSDFQIKYGILNLHLWLIKNRLTELKNGEALFIAKELESKFMNFLNLNASKIHMRKRNDFVKDLRHFLLNARNHYSIHFTQNPITKENLDHKIDALVWSGVFFEKVPRYAPEVYLIADYFIEHFKYLKTMEFSRIENLGFEWDVHRARINCMEELQLINPPLSNEEFLKEKDSKNPIKKYHYGYKEDSKKNPQ